MPEFYLCDVVFDGSCVYESKKPPTFENLECKDCLFHENLILRLKIKELKAQKRGTPKKRQ